MSKQSSIEWLFDYIESNMHEDNFNILSAKETAIRMHKEEIIKAFGYEVIDGEQYYQETYGGNNE